MEKILLFLSSLEVFGIKPFKLDLLGGYLNFLKDYLEEFKKVISNNNSLETIAFLLFLVVLLEILVIVAELELIVLALKTWAIIILAIYNFGKLMMPILPWIGVGLAVIILVRVVCNLVQHKKEKG